MLDDIELVPVPSRETVLADLEVLATDFGRLFATDCECHCRTDRDYWPSRFAEPDESILPKRFGRDNANDWDHIKGGEGLNVEPTGSKTREDYDRAPVFYDRAGRPFVNSVGQSLITAPGWHDSHEIKLRGPGSLRAAETIERANDLVIDAVACFAGVLWPGWALSMRGFCWPNVVDRVAELAKQSTLKPSDWFVTAGGQSYGLSVWRRRDEFTLGGPMVAPEIAERIGDNPEHVWAVRRAFLRDGELAARWLIGALAESSGDEIEADDPEIVCSFDPDSRVLVWCGQSYPLTKIMAGVVGVLFDAWDRGHPCVSIAEIRRSVDSCALAESLGKVFQRRKGDKKTTDPVWYVIEAVSQGVYRLADPKKL